MDHLVDTNVLLRGIDRRHPMCRNARDAIIALRRRGDRLFLVPQNLVEFWVVASRPIAQNGLGMSALQTTAQTARLKRFFPVLPDTSDIHPEWERLVAEHQVLGKTAHDARFVAAMKIHGLKSILTYNAQHFARFPGIQALHPQDVLSRRE